MEADNFWPRGADFAATRAFNWSDLLVWAADDLRLKNEMAEERNRRERLSGFFPVLPGCSNSAWDTTYFDEHLNMWLPLSQRGYAYLNGRARERQEPYVDLTALDEYYFTHPGCEPIRLLFMQRRSPQHVKLDLLTPRWLEKACNHLGRAEQEREYKQLAQNKPQILKESHWGNALSRLLLTVLSEYCYVTNCLSRVRGRGQVRRTGTDEWRLHIAMTFSVETYQCLAMCVGEWCVVHFLGAKAAYSSKLLVSWVCEHTLEVVLCSGSKLAEPCRATRLPIGSVAECYVRFETTCMMYTVPMTAAVDVLSCLRGYFVKPGNSPLDVGLPLIPASCLAKVENGSGLMTGPLDRTQRKAVVEILEQRLVHSIYVVVGPPGTGKSQVLDECVLQVLMHNEEDVAVDAVVHYCLPNNVAVGAAVERLARKCPRPGGIVRLYSDREWAVRSGEATPWQNRRACQFKYEPHMGVIVGTPLACGRIHMSEGSSNRPPLLVIIDEAASLNLAVASTALIGNGEAVRVVIAGDPSQLKPKTKSVLAARLDGNASIFNYLEGQGVWRGDMYCPYPLFGVRLERNYRSHKDLVECVSDLFYHSTLVPARDQDVDERRVTLCVEMAQLGFSAGFHHAIYWIDHSSEAIRDVLDPSLENPLEADLVAHLADEIARRIGAERVLVLSPYNKQVIKLKERFTRKISAQTVDDGLGMEGEVVLVSLVRSDVGHHCRRHTEDKVLYREVSLTESFVADERFERRSYLGFLSEKNRVNVMLSRAKEMIIFVGDRNHFMMSGIPWWTEIGTRAQAVNRAKLFAAMKRENKIK